MINKNLLILLLILFNLIIFFNYKLYIIKKNKINNNNNIEKKKNIDNDDIIYINNDIENDFNNLTKNFISREILKNNLYHYTRHEHMAGSYENFLLANFTKNEMIKYGLKSKLLPFKGLLSRGIERSLKVYKYDKKINKKILVYQPKLTERPQVIDSTSFNLTLNNNSFYGYGASGNVKGKLIYVNYGRIEDYELLINKYNISFKNKITIARYGKCFRGLKVKNAEKFGAIGALIYSDPAEDGYTQNRKVYPKGPWRSKTSIQRGKKFILIISTTYNLNNYLY